MCVRSNTESKTLTGLSLRMVIVFISILPSLAFIISYSIIITGVLGKGGKIKCNRIIWTESGYLGGLVGVIHGIGSGYGIIEQTKLS